MKPQKSPFSLSPRRLIFVLIGLAVFLLIFAVYVSQISKPKPFIKIKQPTAPPPQAESIPQIVAVIGTILEIKKNSFMLTVSPRNNMQIKEEQIIEALISPDTEFKKVSMPKVLTAEMKEQLEKTKTLKAEVQSMNFSDFKVGQMVFVESRGENIYGKKAFTAKLVRLRER